MAEGIVTIKKGREKPIRNRHPWIFSGAIAKAENAVSGEFVTVIDHRGDILGRGYWNHKSQIQVRLLTWDDEPLDEDWWRRMLKRAIDARIRSNLKRSKDRSTAYRLINAENDYLPGLIVDRYADYLVLQALTLGIEARKQMIAKLLAEIVQPIGIYERSDVDVRQREDLDPSVGVLWGDAPPERIEIAEDIRFYVDVYQGHKTGAYLDQTDNRQILRDLMASQFVGSGRLLNMFGYTGTFGLRTAVDDEIFAVTHVDSSYDSLQLAEANTELNPHSPDTFEYIQADAFDYLAHCVDEKHEYDIIVLDPPKFAHNKQQIDRASRGYKNLNLNAFKLIKPGGYVMTFSCSGAISRDLFQKIVFGALADSGRQAQILKHLSAGDDHPIALTFPEGEYLKGLLLRVY